MSDLKSCLDGLNRTGAVTRHALEEEQPSLLVQDGVGRPARVARDVLLDVAPQHVLDVLLLEPSLDDQLIVTVNSSTGSQLWYKIGKTKLILICCLPAKRNCKRCLG